MYVVFSQTDRCDLVFLSGHEMKRKLELYRMNNEQRKGVIRYNIPPYNTMPYNSILVPYKYCHTSFANLVKPHYFFETLLHITHLLTWVFHDMSY